MSMDLEKLAELAAEAGRFREGHDFHRRVARAVALAVISECAKVVAAYPTCECRPKKPSDCGFCECYGYSSFDELEKRIRSLSTTLNGGQP